MSNNTNNPKPGPRPETLKAEGVDWKDAIKHALNKPKSKDQSGNTKSKDGNGGKSDSTE